MTGERHFRRLTVEATAEPPTIRGTAARLAIAFGLVLALASCGGGGNGAADDPTGVGTAVSGIGLVAEQRIGDAVLELGDNVIDDLEAAGTPGGALDTGESGVDTWRLRIDGARTLALGIRGVAGVSLELRDPLGNPVATVASGASPVSAAVGPGIHRVIVRNHGASRRAVRVGWASAAEGVLPGVYVSDLAAFPPSVVGVPTGNTVFIGLAPGPLGPSPLPSPPPPLHSPIQISSFADFQARIDPNYPIFSGGYLADAVRLFYLNGGGTAYVVLISAATLSEHQAAIAAIAGDLGWRMQIVAAPDAAIMPVSAWGEVNRALVKAVEESGAMLLIDPPRAARTLADVPALRGELPTTSGAAVYFPWLLDEAGKALPPSGAMAGQWVRSDATRGVWEAPANISLNGVVAPEIAIDDAQQATIYLPIDGKAFNPVRSFPGRGSVAWGARTLDGNSFDHRFIGVVRLTSYVRQSLDTALQAFVFAPNDAPTWTAVVGMFGAFLTGLWSEGGLMGASAQEAFTVQCGLGSTMTAADVAAGILIAQSTLQYVDLAAFVELTFTQKQDGTAP